MDVQSVNMDGAAVTMAAPLASDSFLNDGRTMLIVTNGGSASITVTVNSVVPCNYGFDHDITVDVGAGATEYIGVFPTGRFNAADGTVGVTFSDITSVTAAAVKF